MQEIIVYRNPIEAALWQGVTSEYFVPIFCGMFAFFVMFIAATKLFERLNWKVQYAHESAIGIGAFFGSIVIWWLWI